MYPPPHIGTAGQHATLHGSKRIESDLIRYATSSRLPGMKRQKRPTIEAKETYYRGKRDLL
jgi:hypothetical protein